MSEKKPVHVLETVNFTNVTKKEIFGADPKQLITLLNKYDSRNTALNPANEEHFEVAQDLVLMYITLN